MLAMEGSLEFVAVQRVLDTRGDWVWPM
jgi:hypothetical protein